MHESVVIKSQNAASEAEACDVRAKRGKGIPTQPQGEEARRKEKRAHDSDEGNEMRKVIVYVLQRKEGTYHSVRVEDGLGPAKFHAWGCDFEALEMGPGNYSTAIIERDDGTIENVPAEMVKFVDAKGDE